MIDPISYRTSGGSELIKSGPGMLHGFQVTSGCPLFGAPTVASAVAFYDNVSGIGNTHVNMLAHARVGATETYAWEPPSIHVFGRGLWLEVVSGSPIVTTSFS